MQVSIEDDLRDSREVTFQVNTIKYSRVTKVVADHGSEFSG